MNFFQPSKKFALILFSLLAILSSAEAAAQATIHVPADEPTIQAGIDAAQNGDTVLVSPGTYNENLDFKGKAITVTTGATSFAAASPVVVNGTTDGPVVNFATNEPASAVLNGFTLQGGHSSLLTATVAGGIFINDASPTITNNIVSNNIGCGIYIVNLASPLIQGNAIKGTSRLNDSDNYCNTTYGPATDGTGIGIAHAGTVQVIGNTIENNSQIVVETDAQGSGAGVYLNGGTEVLLQNNIIRNNLSETCPGLCSSIPPTKLILIQNLIYGNTDANGGDPSPVQVELLGPSSAPYPSLTEINNTIAGVGGGEIIAYQWVSSTIANNLFINTVRQRHGTGAS